MEGLERHPVTGIELCPNCKKYVSKDGDYYCMYCDWVEPEPEENK